MEIRQRRMQGNRFRNYFLQKMILPLCRRSHRRNSGTGLAYGATSTAWVSLPRALVFILPNRGHVGSKITLNEKNFTFDDRNAVGTFLVRPGLQVQVRREDSHLHGYRWTSQPCKTKKGWILSSRKCRFGFLDNPSVAKDGETQYTVTEVGENAFYSCSNLASVIIPNSVTKIEYSAFRDCTSLISVEIPNSVTSIRYGDFYGCSSLNSLVIPNSITQIESYSFCLCENLTSVEIPNSVTTIKEEAFSGCNSLTSVEIPNSVIRISKSAFQGCNSLTSINIEDGNSYYSSVDGILYNKNITELVRCPGAKTCVVIPSSVKTIWDRALSSCHNLTSVEIPNSVTKIGNSAFSSCNSLTYVEIPNSVKTIGEYVFDRCTSLISGGNAKLCHHNREICILPLQ